MILADINKELQVSMLEAVATTAPVFYCQSRDKSKKDSKVINEGVVGLTPARITDPATENKTEETVYDKIVDLLIVSNIDTVNHRININLSSLSGADSINLFTALLLPGEKIEYTTSGRFSIYDLSGVRKGGDSGVGGGSGNGYFPAGW